MIITIAHQKGGVGKSTLTLNVGYALQEHIPTAIIDCDLQGTIMSLKKHITGIDLYSGIASLEKINNGQYKAILLDTPPYLSKDYQRLFQRSDFILMPTKPGIADIMAIRATILQFREAQAQNPMLKAAIVLNMIKPGTTLTDEARELLKQFGVPVMKTQIHDRVSYVRSLAVEKGIMGTGDNKAIYEIQSLTQEILIHIKS